MSKIGGGSISRVMFAGGQSRFNLWGLIKRRDFKKISWFFDELKSSLICVELDYLFWWYVLTRGSRCNFRHFQIKRFLGRLVQKHTKFEKPIDYFHSSVFTPWLDPGVDRAMARLDSARAIVFPGSDLARLDIGSAKSSSARAKICWLGKPMYWQASKSWLEPS